MEDEDGHEHEEEQAEEKGTRSQGRMESILNEDIETLAQEVVRLRSEYEFRTFWLGTRVRGPITQQEAEATRSELNHRVGLRVIELLPELLPTPEGPEARPVLHYPDLRVMLRVAPLLVYGRYRKLSREIPQSKWPCRRCRGAGCEACGGTGKRFLRTVEELVAKPILTASGAGRTKMHSVGREDVDARMLGRGRPFVLSLAEPRRRSFDLGAVETAINRDYPDEVEVLDLQFADSCLLKKVTTISPDKSYRAEVECLTPAGRGSVIRLADINGLQLEQETPRRVLHRRKNLLRRRCVRSCAVDISEPGDAVRRFTLTLRCESGTYVKEFISGDEGRTHPSVSQILGVPCDCVLLDVLEVHCDPLREGSGLGVGGSVCGIRDLRSR